MPLSQSELNLPKGWILRLKGRQLISNEGELFRSFKTAMEHINKSDLYSEYDAQKLSRLVEVTSGTSPELG